jgi:hypothetical protein
MPDPIVDLYVPPAPGNLMRSKQVQGRGFFRLARRDCEFYSIMILCNAWGRARVMDGNGRALWYQPSLFAGSFVLCAGAMGGLIIESTGENANFALNWRESNQEII